MPKKSVLRSVFLEFGRMTLEGLIDTSALTGAISGTEFKNEPATVEEEVEVVEFEFSDKLIHLKDHQQL